MRKDIKIISDLQTFFTKNDADHAIYSLMEVMEHIQIQSKQIGIAKKSNCKLTPLQVLNFLIVFPFFMVKNVYRYSDSSLSRLFHCEKDMFPKQWQYQVAQVALCSQYAVAKHNHA